MSDSNHNPTVSNRQPISQSTPGSEVDSRRVHSSPSLVLVVPDDQIEVSTLDNSGVSLVYLGPGWSTVGSNTDRVPVSSDPESRDLSVCGPICEFCGLEIRDEQRDCPARRDGRCRP